MATLDRQLPVLDTREQPAKSRLNPKSRLRAWVYLSRLLLVVAAVSGLSVAVDSNGEVLALAMTTSPEADRIIGYSGPSNVVLVFDTEQQRIQSSQLLSSGDTIDHVQQVVASDSFWRQFNGLKLGDRLPHRVDGVSGATLTSLAIAEAIQLRISGQRQSLRFPAPVTLAEAQALLPAVARIEAQADECLVQLFDAQEQPLGWLHRTGPQVDSEEGYQGPTELLLLFDVDQVLRNVRIRSSYDNEPYVGYVRQEYSFWAKFKGRSLPDLAGLNVEREEIEGVSGATMTSLAVARTIAASLSRLQAQEQQEAAEFEQRKWNWSMTEGITAAIALLGIVWSRVAWRGRRWPRFLWQIVCLLLLGLYAGNLLSLALLSGWTRGGIQFKLAPGLSLLLIIAVVWPMLTKQNVYCDHICPHGALQQWLMRVRKKRRGEGSLQGAERSGGRDRLGVIFNLLAVTPLLILIAAAGWLLYDWPVHLAWLEPFDAYSWRIGFSISLVVWMIGMGFSYLRPMSYCRVMCPTGKVLGFVRRGQRGPWSWLADTVLLGVSVVAWSMAWSLG